MFLRRSSRILASWTTGEVYLIRSRFAGGAVAGRHTPEHAPCIGCAFYTAGWGVGSRAYNADPHGTHPANCNYHLVMGRGVCCGGWVVWTAVAEDASEPASNSGFSSDPFAQNLLPGGNLDNTSTHSRGGEGAAPGGSTRACEKLDGGENPRNAARRVKAFLISGRTRVPNKNQVVNQKYKSVSSDPVSDEDVMLAWWVVSDKQVVIASACRISTRFGLRSFQVA